MRFNRRTTLAAFGSALAMPYVRPSWAQAATVNFYNWSDYIGETTLQDFEAETGIGVVFDPYASAEEMQAKMLLGSTGYDVVVTAGISQPQMIGAGVYAPIDRNRLTGWGNLDTTVLSVLEGWDPGVRHSVPYMWGTVGFAFNLDMVRERLPENAARLADCGISILDSPTDIMLMVLKYLGLDGDTTDLSDYDKVAAAFAQIRPYIRTFDNSNYLNAIPNGEVCVVNSWSGDYSVAKARAAEAGIEMNLAYFVPRTGAPAWFDVLAIPSDAGNPDGAYAFIDYLLRPEVIAACTNFTGYANANAAATPLVDEALRTDPAIYPDAETTRRLWAPKPFTEEQDRAINRTWATIKAG
jgi:putrescine transport system substrate-binding protein